MSTRRNCTLVTVSLEEVEVYHTLNTHDLLPCHSSSAVATRGVEARLYTSLVGSFMFPCGQTVFAFTQGRTHWIVPIFALTVVSRLKESARKSIVIDERIFIPSHTQVFSSYT